MLCPWQCCLSMMLLLTGLWWVPFCIFVECDACCHISVPKCFLVFLTTPYSPTLCTGIPVIYSGLRNMTVLKTTQSGFEGFLRDRFTTLQGAKDRCFCTSVYARWRFNRIQDVNFDHTWYLSVKDMKNTAFTSSLVAGIHDGVCYLICQRWFST